MSRTMFTRGIAASTSEINSNILQVSLLRNTFSIGYLIHDLYGALFSTIGFLSQSGKKNRQSLTFRIALSGPLKPKRALVMESSQLFDIRSRRLCSQIAPYNSAPTAEETAVRLLAKTGAIARFYHVYADETDLYACS